MGGTGWKRRVQERMGKGRKGWEWVARSGEDGKRRCRNGWDV